jgi:hypothetical protein
MSSGKMENDVKFKICIEGELDNMQQVATFTVTVSAAQQGLTLTPDGGALPAETVGVAVNDPVTTISGGTPPYTFAITAGAPPDGTQLFSTDNPDGSETLTIEGTPTTAGDDSFDVTVTDAAGASAVISSKIRKTVVKSGRR